MVYTVYFVAGLAIHSVESLMTLMCVPLSLCRNGWWNVYPSSLVVSVMSQLTDGDSLLSIILSAFTGEN